MKEIQKITLEDLREIANHSSETRGTPTYTVGVSLAACPTTDCASITRPCPSKG
ncbi:MULTISPECIES: hypothetical protein [Staphylococcus]|uniref:hypothetical protein n=1 Tax=Staphylococcus TaxID=1279 RepID=UPI00136E1F02|nr:MULTISPECIES: hypothetical protein [Staphylococcus]MEB6747779.1 hypothetical protein [Staphylococcus haemolyticus]